VLHPYIKNIVSGLDQRVIFASMVLRQPK